MPTKASAAPAAGHTSARPLPYKDMNDLPRGQEALMINVREALVLAGLSPHLDRESDPARDLGGFGLSPEGEASVRVRWMYHGDLFDAIYSASAAQRDPQDRPSPAWADRVDEIMKRAMAEILWTGGFTVTLRSSSAPGDGSPSASSLLVGPPHPRDDALPGE
ncbi:hypothetical protein [Acrocarpospora sp. B8E8]|uniref:hypothetical protein n=1 Tax=Acrocarpospora sp. B8E8 TaxID=3153572 RepID=UPI00325D5BB0